MSLTLEARAIFERRQPELLKEYAEGEKMDYLAAKYGISRFTISKLVKKLGLKCRPHGPQRGHLCNGCGRPHDGDFRLYRNRRIHNDPQRMCEALVQNRYRGYYKGKYHVAHRAHASATPPT